MKQYKELVKRCIASTGVMYRNGIRHSSFGEVLTFDLREGFPLVTLKKTNWKLAFGELLWFISGSTQIKDLEKIMEGSGVDDPGKIWRPFANKDGYIGRIYGFMWRHHPVDECMPLPAKPAPGYGIVDQNKEFDQLQYVIENIKKNPYSTRHRIATYSPFTVGNESASIAENIARGKGGITPCVSLLHFTVENVRGVDTLNLNCTHASNDILLGGPFNYAQYALLLTLVAREVNMPVKTLRFFINDAHVYGNQIPKLIESEFMEREPKKLPTLELAKGKRIYDITLKDIFIKNYSYYPFINFPLS